MAIDTPARIAVIGAGPIGLEAGLYGRYLGYEVDIYERGRVADHVLAWGHAKMFTPFGSNASTLGLAALQAQDESWRPPASGELLTGRAMTDAYWRPLAQSDLLVDGMHEHTEVLTISREGLLKSDLCGDETRGDGLFRLLLRTTSEMGQRHERVATADIVIDTSGVFGCHNWIGEGGMPAVGELDAATHIDYGLPDVLGADRDRYAGRNVLVVGSGYSAATVVVELGQLARECSDTWITWITRPDFDADGEPIARHPPMVRIAHDRLPARDRIAREANTLAADDSNHVSYWPATTVESLARHVDLDRFAVKLRGKHAGELEVDRIVAGVGHRPDDRLFAELQVSLCPVTGAPATLSARLGRHPSADFLDQVAHGSKSLINPEPHFYVLGAKSYGRRGDFTIAIGLQQIRDVFSLIGDRESLDLYASARVR